jgi:hypothetical protein
LLHFFNNRIVTLACSHPVAESRAAVEVAPAEAAAAAAAAVLVGEMRTAWTPARPQPPAQARAQLSPVPRVQQRCTRKKQCCKKKQKQQQQL